MTRPADAAAAQRSAIDAPPPTTPRVDLGDDIGSALAAELGIDLPPQPDADAPRITRTMTASLSDRITSAWPHDPPDDHHR
jgi:hypothetical protein